MYQGYFENVYGKVNKKKLSLASQSLQYWYKYEKNLLFERAITRFEWDTKGEIPCREIEKIRLSNGMVVITDKYKGARKKLAAFHGEFAGEPTVYFDLYKEAAYYSPIDSRILKINKECCVGFSNSTMMSIEPIVHSFAVLLAHCDLSIIHKLVEARESYVPAASNDMAMEAWKQYRTNLLNGAFGAVNDPALMNVDIKTFPAATDCSITELQEFKKNSFEMYLNMIGVKTSHEKKGNMIEEEVNANDSMLIFNLRDEEICVRELCDNVNNLYGREWTVKKADCIDYEAQLRIAKGDDEDEGNQTA